MSNCLLYKSLLTSSDRLYRIINTDKLIRYTGNFFVQPRTFKCAIDDARCFYRVANAVFGKVGRLAPDEVKSEEIILQLIKSKCISMFLWPVH